MNDYELIERAEEGEIIGNGSEQIAALLARLKEWDDRHEWMQEFRRKDREQRHLWEGKHAVLRHENNKLRARNERLTVALADAIRRPMGMVPYSATGLVTQDDLDAAEQRRQRMS